MKIKKVIKYILLAAFLLSLGYFSAVYFSESSLSSETKETAMTIANEKSYGAVLGEEESGLPSKLFSSQNFHAPQISFGGEAMVLPSGQQAESPKITDLKSELFVTKSDQKVKFVLNWETNKPCLSSIGFKKEGDAQEKIISEEGYGFIHGATLSPLNFSTAYSYTVTARDKWGNETQSEKLVFYTGAPDVSVFDLLNDAFKDMFGKK